MDGVVEEQLEDPLCATLTPNRAHLSPQEHRQTADKLRVGKRKKTTTVSGGEGAEQVPLTDLRSEVESDISYRESLSMITLQTVPYLACRTSLGVLQDKQNTPTPVPSPAHSTHFGMMRLRRYDIAIHALSSSADSNAVT